jgi:hypothetical protein
MVNDVAGSLTIGYDRLSDAGTCSRLSGGGEFPGFRTCKAGLEAFSPAGNLILAGPAYGDGLGDGEISMFDLEGGALFDRKSTAESQSFYPVASWEDATHALAPVFQDGRWAVVRFASDGSMEYAVPPAPGQAEKTPYVVAAGGPTLGG